MRILVTGSTGFIGRALTRRLLERGSHLVRVALRDEVRAAPPGVERCIVGDIGASTDWTDALRDVQVVMHLAARVHVTGNQAGQRASFRSVNVDGAIGLGRQAAAQGVGRLVFLSTVKVHGTEGQFIEEDHPDPADPYSASKAEAEAGLRAVARRTGLGVVIVRPPLVYGPGVGANFGSLIRAVRRGWPLPLGAVHNRRSMIAVDNLVEFLMLCATHPAAANETFLVADDEALSTADWIRRLARAMDRPARLLPVSPRLLTLVARLVGRGQDVRRLLGTLEVDTAKARRVLGWSPIVTTTQGLERAVRMPPDASSPAQPRTPEGRKGGAVVFGPR